MTRLFVEHLSVIDCAYLDSARGLVGESWIVDVELEGALDEESMVIDFGEVKRRLKRVVDAHADHRLLVPARASALQTLEQKDDAVHLVFRADIGVIEHRSPAVAVLYVDAAEVTPEVVAADLAPRLHAVLPANVGAVRATLRAERIQGAYYHYTHGLRKHRGACQRIAHGHRSKIHVHVSGQRDAELEMQVATRWLDVYLGTRADLVAQGNGRVRFAYTAPEGHYQLVMPQTHVDLLDRDSTVECIAEHLARLLAPLRPGREIEVRAYEGVMKGAIARARV
ncbi:6-carboxytetrahydropterin synthase [Sinimarinibacterium thermocellulolyticum]|uniref:6-carboxy-5,6,7,8-tetrahydropterin synthase n=1 Tax=Sinimarinibacterium thermocellulolyticum TaxID=3170016 RepID=A0ABV2A5X1_9GAMM